MFPQLRPILAYCLLTCFALCQPTKGKPSGPTETISISVHEGTDLSFDVSPDGRSIAFDLLGQLWLLPAKGGKAKAITNAVRDVAEDFDPTFAPDGRRVVFRGERNGRTGLWLLDLVSGNLRQLTQLPDPDGMDEDPAWSPDGRVIAFMHAVPPESATARWRTAIMLLDVSSGKVQELSVTGIKSTFFSMPVWTKGGTRIAFVAKQSPATQGGQIWSVSTAGGPATPLTTESLLTQAPAISADNHKLAYFAPDSAGQTQVWVQGLDENSAPKGAAQLVTNHKDVAPNRIRWAKDGSSLFYAADGRMWRVATSGGQPSEIPFNVELSIIRPKRALPEARFPEPGRMEAARGFMSLVLSPDGQQIGVLALGKLWLIPVGGKPRAIANVPFEATSLAWSPDGSEVAWSAGVSDKEDLFATDLKTGVTRTVTSLAGREAFPTYSPDGRYLAFVHLKDDGVLRVIEAKTSTITDVAKTKELGAIGTTWTCTPQWSPESDGLLVCGPAVPNQPGRATFVPLSGQHQPVIRFPNAPIFVNWTAQKRIAFVRHDRLWEAPFDPTGTLSEAKPIGNEAALYASASRDGALLFVSGDGLRLRSADGSERKLGWPLTYTPPVPESLLIRNVRIIDGKGGPTSSARDVLIERGRISRIAPRGTISMPAARVLDADGRFLMPGLIDLHAHIYRPTLLPGHLYFGVTTIRDQGSSMAPLVAYRDSIAAGVLPGPRIGYGGFQFYSDWAFDEEQGRGIEPEADADHISRSVTLAQAFGAQHIKTRTFRRWDINARMITEAHRRGMRATGHCSQQLSLIAGGMDAKEHTGLCESRGNGYVYDDLVQLFKAAGIGVVPTIIYRDFALRLNEKPNLLDDDPELAPFVPSNESFEWMLKLNQAARKRWSEELEFSRPATMKFARGGVTVGAGTDIWQLPTGVHMEMEQLVKAGLSPSDAIRAGTIGAAQILGAGRDLGSIKVGKWADLILLDADPLVDIRNTRRIWQVIHDGQLVDRPAILKAIKPR